MGMILSEKPSHGTSAVLCLSVGVVRGFRLLATRGLSKTNWTRMTTCDEASLEALDLLQFE